MTCQSAKPLIHLWGVVLMKVRIKGIKIATGLDGLGNRLDILYSGRMSNIQNLHFNTPNIHLIIFHAEE